MYKYIFITVIALVGSASAMQENPQNSQNKPQYFRFCQNMANGGMFQSVRNFFNKNWIACYMLNEYERCLKSQNSLLNQGSSWKSLKCNLVKRDLAPYEPQNPEYQNAEHYVSNLEGVTHHLSEKMGLDETEKINANHELGNYLKRLTAKSRPRL